MNDIEIIGPGADTVKEVLANHGIKSTVASATAHTPGPWRASHASINAVSHGQWFQVAKAGCRKLNEAGNYANARLIAAAPELLEALIGLVQAGHFDDEQAKRIRMDLLDKARATIAKATGGGVQP